MEDLCEGCHEPLDEDREGCCAGYCEECSEGRCPQCEEPLDCCLCDQPDEGDYVTEDFLNFYQYGKLAVAVAEGEPWAHILEAHMKHEQFWPDVWFISDHGNAHLVDMFDALQNEEQS